MNSKLLADYYASQTGFRVLVPDIIPGGGVPLDTLTLTEAVTSPVKWWDIGGQFWWAVSLVRLLSRVIPFAVRTHGVFPSILAYARAVKADGGKIGLAGFCWGGLQTTKLSQEPATKGGEDGLVDCHFTAHPVGLKPKDFVESVRKFHVPLSMALGEKDAYLKKEAVASIEAALRTELGTQEEYTYEVKVYPDCVHGFAVRADPGRIVENDAAGKASDQAVAHFKKYLT